MGIRSRDTKSDTLKVETIDTPICLARSFTRNSDEKIKGINTAMVVPVAATMDLHTSPVPRTTASDGLTPKLLSR